MRLVVGPLPASVYWRRRAVVLGGVALAVLMIVYSCNGSSGTASPEASPSATASAQAPSPAASEEGVVAPVGVASTIPSAPAVADPQVCTDDELRVTAAPEETKVAKGSGILIKLIIKNTSKRDCRRDVGADQQELYLVLGTERIWSSDHCDGPAGNDLRTLPAGHERSYQAVWNGKSSTSCSATEERTPTGPVPAAGEYQLFGRLGTDLSDPVVLTLT